MKNIKTFENFNNQDIFDYIRTDDIESVKKYIDSGHDLNVKNEYGDAALIHAVDNDKYEIVKLLLSASADLNKQNDGGNTALIYAAYYNNVEIVELLLDYYADEFILNDRNKSFYDCLNDENKEYFTQNYPTSVYNAISHNYKKSFTEFVKDYNIKNNK